MEIKLISVSEKYWGRNFPKNMPELAKRLLGKKEKKTYDFTGEKRPRCEHGMTLVFRYDGFLLGEGRVVDVHDDGWRITYLPVRLYQPPVKGRRFFNTGANAYYELTAEQLNQIRRGIVEESSDTYVKTGEKPGTRKHRVGQGAIRDAALDRYQNRCCLCGIDDPRLLVAGHIKGWAKGEKERGEPENVILMCLLHDGLFGKGLMALKAHNYHPELAEKVLPTKTIKVVRMLTTKFREPTSSPPSRQLLRWHRKNVFRRND